MQKSGKESATSPPPASPLSPSSPLLLSSSLFTSPGNNENGHRQHSSLCHINTSGSIPGNLLSGSAPRDSVLASGSPRGEASWCHQPFADELRCAACAPDHSVELGRPRCNGPSLSPLVEHFAVPLGKDDSSDDELPQLLSEADTDDYYGPDFSDTDSQDSFTEDSPLMQLVSSTPMAHPPAASHKCMIGGGAGDVGGNVPQSALRALRTLLNPRKFHRKPIPFPYRYWPPLPRVWPPLPHVGPPISPRQVPHASLQLRRARCRQ